VYNRRIMNSRSTYRTLIALAFCLALLEILSSLSALSAQSSSQALAAQTPNADWEKAAGGHMEFDIASVKPDFAPPVPGTVSTNVPMGAENDYVPTGGLLVVRNYLLREYIMFAYKLTGMTAHGVFMRIPITMNNRYDIEARAPMQNPTKDQLRLMMQSLLAERFKLKIHYESRSTPAFAIVIDKPGKLGPKLREHKDDGAPCPSADTPVNANTLVNGSAPTTTGGYPVQCGEIVYWPAKTQGITRMGARNISAEMMASAFWPFCGMERPIVDKTGLGPVDFLVEFSPPSRLLSTEGQDQIVGATFQEAVKAQLGLKLEPGNAPVDKLIIDHIEEPTPN
jgi:uncharacterized protein (TIGR03435 family)